MRAGTRLPGCHTLPQAAPETQHCGKASLSDRQLGNYLIPTCQLLRQKETPR